MNDTALRRQEVGRIMEAGVRRFEQIPAAVKAELYGQHIAISTNTGRFVTTEDDEIVKLFAESLAPGDHIWMTRVC